MLPTPTMSGAGGVQDGSRGHCATGGQEPAPLLARGPAVAEPGGEEIKIQWLPLEAGRHRLQGLHTFHTESSG